MAPSANQPVGEIGRTSSMFPQSLSDWLAFLSVVVPLAVTAISAAAYVWNQLRDNQHRDYKKFFEITDYIGRKDGSIVSKVAAIYELRKYRKYRDVIIRICDGVEVEGASKPADLLRSELKMTKEFFERT